MKTSEALEEVRWLITAHITDKEKEREHITALDEAIRHFKEMESEE